MRKNLLPTRRLIRTLIPLCLLIIGSGCRIGNNLERIVFPDNTVPGYYRLPANRIDFCAQTEGNPAQCARGSFDDMPVRYRWALTDPVAFSGSSPQDPSRFAFYDPFADPIQAIVETFINTNTWVLGSSANLLFDPEWYMADGGCEEIVALNTLGKMERYEEAQEHSSGLLLFGKVNFTIQEVTVFTDVGTPPAGRACLPALTKIEACYQNHLNCEAETETDNFNRHLYLQSYLGPYVNLGILSVSDFVNLTQISFTANYE